MSGFVLYLCLAFYYGLGIRTSKAFAKFLGNEEPDYAAEAGLTAMCVLTSILFATDAVITLFQAFKN